jgi:hypothetical protein
MRNAQLKTRLYLACLLVLAAGLCSAALALTIACLSTVAAAALFLFASWLPSDRE